MSLPLFRPCQLSAPCVIHDAQWCVWSARVWQALCLSLHVCSLLYSQPKEKDRNTFCRLLLAVTVMRSELPLWASVFSITFCCYHTLVFQLHSFSSGGPPLLNGHFILSTYWWHRRSYVTNFSTFEMESGNYSQGFSRTTDLATQNCTLCKLLSDSLLRFGTVSVLANVSIR